MKTITMSYSEYQKESADQRKAAEEVTFEIIKSLFIDEEMLDQALKDEDTSEIEKEVFRKIKDYHNLHRRAK